MNQPNIVVTQKMVWGPLPPWWVWLLIVGLIVVTIGLAFIFTRKS